jgi:hypothetical protein
LASLEEAVFGASLVFGASFEAIGVSDTGVSFPENEPKTLFSRRSTEVGPELVITMGIRDNKNYSSDAKTARGP